MLHAEQVELFRIHCVVVPISVVRAVFRIDVIFNEQLSASHIGSRHAVHGSLSQIDHFQIVQLPHLQDIRQGKKPKIGLWKTAETFRRDPLLRFIDFASLDLLSDLRRHHFPRRVRIIFAIGQTEPLLRIQYRRVRSLDQI